MAEIKKGSSAEHPLAERVRSRVFTGWLVAVGAFILGGLISVFGNEIRFATRLAIVGRAPDPSAAMFAGQPVWVTTRGGVDWMVLVFWVATGVWSAFLAVRLSSEDATETDRVMRLLRAIHRTPNLNVLRDYPDYYFGSAFGVLTGAATAGEGDNERLMEIAGERIRAALIVVRDMAKEFSRSTDARYTANVMLLVKPDRFPAQLHSTLRFHEVTNLGALKYVAHLPAALCDEEPRGESRDLTTPLISLPIPISERDRFGSRLTLPGAPTAVVSDRGASVEENAAAMADQCTHLGTIAREVAEYFGPNGAGAEIKSLASFRIGTRDDPVGVLNIDSNKLNVLGRDDEFYITFYALLAPILEMLRPVVTQFAEAYWNS